MKLLRYGPVGHEKPGLYDNKGIIRDLSAIVGDINGALLSSSRLEALAALDASTLPAVPSGTRLGPCVGAVGKMICVGLNYSNHAAESNMAIPSEPILFMKATSAIVGPNDEVEIPPGADKVDWEVELGVVIGKPGRYIPKEDALAHVAGYCVIRIE